MPIEFWFCCEDLTRNVEDQRVAFGPFKDHREARAFGWALSYAERGDGTYCSFDVRQSDDLQGRLKVLINPEDGVREMGQDEWDERLVWPPDGPYNEHDDSGWQWA